jgi:hypothetical protein
MSAMLRPLFTVLSALSLVLCVATCMLWVRSFWKTETWKHATEDDQWTIWFQQGRVFLSKQTADDGPPLWQPVGISHTSDLSSEYLPDDFPRWEWKGLRIDKSGSQGIYFRCLTIPLWILSAALILLPLVFATSSTSRWLIAHTRRAMKVCAICGYDLRATPDQCPECGTVSKKKI